MFPKIISVKNIPWKKKAEPEMGKYMMVWGLGPLRFYLSANSLCTPHESSWLFVETLKMKLNDFYCYNNSKKQIVSDMRWSNTKGPPSSSSGFLIYLYFYHLSAAGA